MIESIPSDEGESPDRCGFILAEPAFLASHCRRRRRQPRKTDEGRIVAGARARGVGSGEACCRRQRARRRMLVLGLEKGDGTHLLAGVTRRLGLRRYGVSASRSGLSPESRRRTRLSPGLAWALKPVR